MSLNSSSFIQLLKERLGINTVQELISKSPERYDEGKKSWTQSLEEVLAKQDLRL